MSLPALYHLRLKYVDARNSMKSSPLARTGACEGYEEEPTDTLVEAIYACAHERVLPLMEDNAHLLTFKTKPDDDMGIPLHTLWLGKCICLLFACRLVLSMTNVVVRYWYDYVTNEALDEMWERLKEASRVAIGLSGEYEFASWNQFLKLVTAVEARLFHEGEFRYICSQTNQLDRFNTNGPNGPRPICTDAEYLCKKLYEYSTGCYFKQAPEVLRNPITQAHIKNLLASLSRETSHDMRKYVPDPQQSEALARGTFGQVYTRLLNPNTPSQERIAEKVIQTSRKRRGLDGDHVREIVLLKLKPVQECQFIAKLLDVIIDTTSLQIHLYMPWRISLSKFMRMEYPDTHPKEVVQSMTSQMLSGLEVLYNLNVAHRDLKPGNILVSYDQFLADGGTRKGDRWLEITDFGLARQVDPDMANPSLRRFPYVTLWYRSPEALAKDYTPYERVHQASDIWSVGCILYELATGKPLFNADNEVETLRRILVCLNFRVDPKWKENTEHPLSGVFDHIGIQDLTYYESWRLETLIEDAVLAGEHMDLKHTNYEAELAYDIRMMLTVDPTQRPTAADLLHGDNKLALLHGIDPETTRF